MFTLKEKEKQFKKQIIAQAAYELFSKQPYEAVTVDDIARAAGCGKGTIYQYFYNKDYMLTYLVAQDLQKLCANIQEQCVQNLDVMSAMNNYLDLQYEYYLENHQIYSSWFRLRLNHTIRQEWIDEVNGKIETKVQMIATLLDRGMAENLFITLNSYQLAMLLENIFRDVNFIFEERKLRDYDLEKIQELMKLVLTHGIYVNKTLQDKGID